MGPWLENSEAASSARIGPADAGPATALAPSDGRGPAAPGVHEAAGARRADEEVNTYPNLVFIELLATLGVAAFFTVVSVLFNAPLEEIADPAVTPNPSKAPWYFVGLQELLVYFDPWIAGVMIPLLLIFGLMAIPYLDRNPAGRDAYEWSARKFAVTVFTFGLGLWFALILLGYYLRGPSWQLYWPWESWAVEKPLTNASWSFPLLWGVATLAVYGAAGLLFPAVQWPDFRRNLGGGRYLVVMSLCLLMGGVVLKMALRLLFNVKYILVTPWFNL